MVIHLLNLVNIGTAIYACFLAFITSTDQNSSQKLISNLIFLKNFNNF